VQRIQVKVTEKDCGKRLDVLLAEKIPTLTRTHIQKIIRNKYVWVNDVPQKVSYRVSPEELICLEIIDPVPLQTVPEAIPLEIIFEDSWIIVVNKPAGMVVHPSWGHYSGTLVHALLYHCPTLAGIGGTIRPGIVHRIDKGTSGILVVAKNDQAHQALSDQFKNHTIGIPFIEKRCPQNREKDGRQLPIGGLKIILQTYPFLRLYLKQGELIR
jgi:23S rRNA pseudouridine1911/1915/1917 synthase